MNEREFQGLSRPWKRTLKFKSFQDAYEPCGHCREVLTGVNVWIFCLPGRIKVAVNCSEVAVSGRLSVATMWLRVNLTHGWWVLIWRSILHISVNSRLLHCKMSLISCRGILVYLVITTPEIMKAWTTIISMLDKSNHSGSVEKKNMH